MQRASGGVDLWGAKEAAGRSIGADRTGLGYVWVRWGPKMDDLKNPVSELDQAVPFA